MPKSKRLKTGEVISNFFLDDNSENKLLQKFKEDRFSTAKSVISFNLLEQRVIVSSKISRIQEKNKYILYWMCRDMRIQDNWALLFSQKLCMENNLSLLILYCIDLDYPHISKRYTDFILEGLKEIENECNELRIKFCILTGSVIQTVSNFIKYESIAGVVTDFTPLKYFRRNLNEIVNIIPGTIPVFTIDTHNIVPVWVASQKEEYGAKSIRFKINSQLYLYCTKFPPLIQNNNSNFIPNKHNWSLLNDKISPDESVKKPSWASGGYTNSVKILELFLTKKLLFYNSFRNDPNSNVLSNLSPWLHFGHISVQRCILEIESYRNQYPKDVSCFCEEAIIRRELADNFCYYNQNYDNFEGLPIWAKISLQKHSNDIRDYVYSIDDFEKAKTHDDLWNAAQIQLLSEGKIHGFLRMYWAKKILEWSVSPEEAIRIAIFLNDKYSLDGFDPNGYVGCLWSIGGLHDQGWKERNVFGKIRYMNYSGCLRKFNVGNFLSKYKS